MRPHLITLVCLFITLSCNCSHPIDEEEQFIPCENVIPGTYTFQIKDCESSNPEYNMCHRTVMFQENSRVFHLLNGGDIMTEGTFSIDGKILTVWDADGTTPVLEFNITRCNPIIDINSGDIYKRSL
jgi:hypothetical protein